MILSFNQIGTSMSSRNQRYEAKQKSLGLVKVTLWVPSSVEPEIKQVASACCENPDLTIASLRSLSTGRLISLRKV